MNNIQGALFLDILLTVYIFSDAISVWERARWCCTCMYVRARAASVTSYELTFNAKINLNPRTVVERYSHTISNENIFSHTVNRRA